MVSAFAYCVTSQWRGCRRSLIVGAAGEDGRRPLPATALTPGSMLRGGRFRVGERIQGAESAGGATMYFAQDLSVASSPDEERLGADAHPVVKLKVVSLQQSRAWRAVDLLEREATILKGLSHPSIPELVDYFREGQKEEFDAPTATEDALFCLVQQYAPGFSLEQQLQRGWRPTDDEVVEVIHGFISPKCVIIDRKKTDLQLYGSGIGSAPPSLKTWLVGWSNAADLEMLRARPIAMNSVKDLTFSNPDVSYLAPEIWSTKRSTRSDQYSVAATIVSMLCQGRSPQFLADENDAINIQNVAMSRPLRRVLTKMLQSDPTDRFYSASAAVRCLEVRPKIPESNRSGSRSGTVSSVVDIRAGEGDILVSPPKNSKIRTIDTGQDSFVIDIPPNLWQVRNIWRALPLTVLAYTLGVMTKAAVPEGGLVGLLVIGIFWSALFSALLDFIAHRRIVVTSTEIAMEVIPFPQFKFLRFLGFRTSRSPDDVLKVERQDRRDSDGRLIDNVVVVQYSNQDDQELSASGLSREEIAYVVAKLIEHLRNVAVS